MGAQTLTDAPGIDLGRSPRADGCLLLRFENETVGLDTRLRALREFLEGNCISTRALYRAELAFEELVTNIIRHAYRDRDNGKHPIEVGVAVRGGEVVMTVEDEGPPFDPVQVPESPIASSLEDSKIGGLGLRLVRFATTQMQYERASGRNRVTVRIPSS